jgi:hypothetical protein
MGPTEKYELLEFLKGQAIPGPFTNTTEIAHYITSTPDSDQKRDRMRKEVKYARMTCGYLKTKATVFKLTRNSKPLTTEEYTENFEFLLRYNLVT